MKKGSLLIVWSLLLAMMFGMSVHATSYCVSGDMPVNNNWAQVEGKSGKETLHDGDIIYANSVYTIIVDGKEDTVSIGGEMQRAEWTYTGPTQEFEWKVSSYNNALTVTLESIPAPGGGGEEETTEVEDDDDEPDVPQKTEEQIFTENLIAGVAAKAKAGDNVVIDATIWHSFSAKVLEQLFAKEGVSYTIYYYFEGEYFYITIPANAALEEGCDWYGPLKLNAMFGRTMITKVEYEEAIAKIRKTNKSFLVNRYNGV